MKNYLSISIFLFFVLAILTACEKKAQPRVMISSKLKRPIVCMKLDRLIEDKELLNSLNRLYTFSDSCPLTLTLSSKKDIVCNSTVNMMNKNMGKFPKSFLKLELRRGIKVEYSYYIDLYSNVDKDDLEDGFERLKKDLLLPKGAE